MCNFILTRGKNKGKKCSLTNKYNGYCKRHSKVEKKVVEKVIEKVEEKVIEKVEEKVIEKVEEVEAIDENKWTWIEDRVEEEKNELEDEEWGNWKDSDENWEVEECHPNIVNYKNINTELSCNLIKITYKSSIDMIFDIRLFFDSNLKSTEIYTKELKTGDIDTFTRIKINKNIQSLKLNLKEDFVKTIINMIENTITNISSTCYFCEKNCHSRKKINLCGDLKCLVNGSFFSYELYEEIEKNPERFSFMLYLFIYSCSVNRVPCILPENTNLEKIMEIVSVLPQLDELEKYTMQNLSDEAIGILTWLVVSYSGKINTDFSINDITDEKKIKFSNADPVKIMNLCHGSSDHNYFNIIMNGLKNYSGTKYMSAGNAFGNGVYFGTCGTASVYNKLQSSKIGILTNSKYYNKSKILNCKIYHEKPEWHSGPSCTVIPDESNIIIEKISFKINRNIY